MKGIIILILGVGLLASLLIPFFSGYDTFGLDVRKWIIISTATGAALFCLIYSETPVMSIICGSLLGFVMQASHFYYFNIFFKNRETFARIEILIPIILGVVSSISIYNLYLTVSGKSKIGKGEGKL